MLELSVQRKHRGACQSRLPLGLTPSHVAPNPLPLSRGKSRFTRAHGWMRAHLEPGARCAERAPCVQPSEGARLQGRQGKGLS